MLEEARFLNQRKDEELQKQHEAVSTDEEANEYSQRDVDEGYVEVYDPEADSVLIDEPKRQ